MQAEVQHDVNADRPRRNTVWYWCLLILLSGIIGFGANAIRVPAGWMVGPMIVSLLFSVSGRRNARISKAIFSGAQMVIGVLIAGTFHVNDIPLLIKHWYAVLLVSAGTLIISVVIGYGLASRNIMDRATAFLGVMPGGASGMVAMSSSMSADTKIVALMQYVRMITVVATASLVTKSLSGSAVSSHPSTLATTTDAHWVTWCVSLAVGAAGSFLGVKFRVPAGAMLGSMACCLVLNLTGLMQVSAPAPLTAIAYATIGIYVGLLFDRDSIVHAGKLLPTIVFLGPVVVRRVN